jgi:hypothetical protein
MNYDLGKIWRATMAYFKVNILESAQQDLNKGPPNIKA